jgi:hypothetical protein
MSLLNHLAGMHATKDSALPNKLLAISMRGTTKAEHASDPRHPKGYFSGLVIDLFDDSNKFDGCAQLEKMH